MKIVVLGASGKAGSLITEEALNRQLDVAVVVRDKSKISNSNINNVIERDLLDLTYDDLKSFDVIVSALGFWGENTPMHSTSAKHLLNLLEGKDNRIIFVGGAGSLYVDSEHTTHLMDTPEFPEAYKPVASAMLKAFEIIREADNIKWSYFSPAPEFNADGPRTGEYKLGKEEVILNSQGNPAISYADYAIALVDEIENNQHSQQRFTAVSG